MPWDPLSYQLALARARVREPVACQGCGKPAIFYGDPMQKCPHCGASLQKVNINMAQAKSSNAQTAKGQPVGNTGVMVALYPHKDMASKLALPGGEPKKDIHLTLAFLGDKKDLGDPQALKDVVQKWASRQRPMTGEISGHGLFTAGAQPVTYVSPDVPGLPGAREDLIQALEASGHKVAQDHGFTPHMTLDYADRTADLPDHGGKHLSFPSATVAIGDEHTDFPLGGSSAR